MKTYSHAPDVDGCIEKIQAAHHGELMDVTVSALFVYDDEESSKAVLTHAAAIRPPRSCVSRP